jgi:predicted nucleotidyltransferase
LLNLDDPISLALLTAEHLREAGVAHALCGGLALAAYGQPRETKDADVSVLDAKASLVADALAQSGALAAVAFERMRFGGLLLSRVTLLGDGAIEGLNMVDLVQPRSARFARDLLVRAIEAPLRGTTIRVVSPEDFILLKVLSTRDKDLDDAASVVRREAETLDRSSLEREVALLADEIADHDVAQRWADVVERAASREPR